MRYRIGEIVRGLTTNNITIIGEYRGYRSSFGVLIFGIPVGSADLPQEWTCLRLTLERVSSPKKEVKFKQRFAPGEPVSGITLQKTKALGFYMNADGKYSWLKGWPEGVSRFMPQQAIKVLTSSLKKA